MLHRTVQYIEKYVEADLKQLAAFPMVTAAVICYLTRAHTHIHKKRVKAAIDKICSNTDDDDDGRCETKRS